jgi:hypothetical protein
MLVPRLMSVIIFAALLAGCASNVEKARKAAAELRTFLGGIKDPDECQAPGTFQNIICNYRLEILNKVGDSLYQARIDPALVAQSEDYCIKYRKEHPKEDYDYPCKPANEYYYHRYEFEVEPKNNQLEERRVYQFTNVAHTTKLREGYIKEGNETVIRATPVTSPNP